MKRKEAIERLDMLLGYYTSLDCDEEERKYMEALAFAVKKL